MEAVMESLHIHQLHNANLWAILVSALILWLLGAGWYSPALFAKPWMAALSIHPDKKEKQGLIIAMISSFIGDLILSFVLWHFIMWSGAHSWLMGAFIGFLCWFGFIAAPSFPQGLYESRPFNLFAINTGYWLVGLLAVGALLAVWR
jgi:hypothetical protein